jgi:hypothetical protein
VTSFHPLPQTVVDASVDMAEDFTGYDMPVIIGPAPDFGIELTDHGYGAHSEVLSNGFPDITQEGSHTPFGGLNNKLAIVFAYILSEKIKAFIYPYDTGFLLG